jgi:CRISPR-associated protein Cas1
MTTLYVREQGAQVRRVSQRIQVVKGSEVLETVRLHDLERVALFGNIGMSAPAMTALLDAGIETTLLTLNGRFRGRLSPAEGKNIFLRQAQFRQYEDEAFRVRTARAIIEAKVHNARSMLQRHHWNHPSPVLVEAADRLNDARKRISAQTSLESLLGTEGDCARVYFSVFGTMVRSEFAFTTRSRRPPRDPVNALLSFGYALLTTELTGAVAAQGLDPHVGVLHDLDYGRPSLALDIEEEFRQPVIDRLVLSLVNLGVIQHEHFDFREDAGVFLNESGRLRYLECYHRALETEFEEKIAGQRMTFRTLFLRQARRMRGAIQGEGDYVPYRMR